MQGLWIGMLTGVVTETMALSFMMWRTNWDEEVTIQYPNLTIHIKDDNFLPNLHKISIC